MSVPASLSLTESQCFTVLGDFITAVLPSGVDVEQGQVNRVPSSAGPNYVIMSPLRRRRLGTNETSYADNVFEASIAGTVMTVSATTYLVGPGIQAGMQIVDGNWPNTVAANTAVVAQLTGSPLGGVGTYAVNNSQTVASETMYTDQRQDLQETELVVQVDVYGLQGGPAGDYAQTLSTLLRSEVATEFFRAENPAVSPLHADDPRQLAFVDGESQYEERWTLDVHLQVNGVVGVPQQFATVATVTPVDVEGSFPP
jgi:hypothetical protein